MNVFEIVDYIQRKINSILFRLVLITYSILVLISFDNLFETYIYVLIISLFIVNYIMLQKHSRLRLLNDFVFIFFMVVGKNPNDIVIFIYILMPIINSINFSGNSKSGLLYFMSLFVYLSFSCFYYHSYNVEFLLQNYFPLISIFFLWLVDKYTSLRVKTRIFRESLNSVVDSFYTDGDVTKKPHEIYQSLINVINDKIKRDLVKEMYCFTVSGVSSEKMIIVNGTTFVWKYEFRDTQFLQKLKGARYFFINTPIVLDGVEKNSNISMIIKSDEYEYVFVFIISGKIPLYYLIIGLFRTLEPSLSKLAKILLSEKRLQEIKNEELIKLSQRSQYVNRANKAMHYIRNRLTPIVNLILLIDEMDKIEKGKKKDFIKIFNSEKIKAKSEIEKINKRADYLLDKSNNPFNFSDVSKSSIMDVFRIIRRNYNYYFPNNDIDIKDNINDGDQYVLINEEGFEIFLSDWLNNVKKYKKDRTNIEFEITEEDVVVKFYNDFSSSVAIVSQMMSDLMSNDRNEIMRRTTHGLYQIKTTLEDMSIPFNVFFSDSRDFVVFELKLKIYKNENCNI